MLSIPGQVKESRDSFRRLLGFVSHWVAVSKWTKKVLAINGGLAKSVSVCRQAVCHEKMDAVVPPAIDLLSRGNGLKLGFVGRIHPHKGLHVLLQALYYLPSEKLEVHIVGDRSAAAPEYRRLLSGKSCDDSRVKWLGERDPTSIPEFIRSLDVLVVPSLWMETGPMTVLEAWAVGVPIIGSDRGGIKEWVDEYGGGWLFPAGDARRLASIVENIINKQMPPPTVPEETTLFSMKSVARTMVGIYRDLT